MDTEKIKELMHDFIVACGENPLRDGLKNTPTRVSKSYSELLSGYNVDLDKLVNGALFDVSYDEMVVVKDINFYSLCEHHLLPFYGKASVGYVPDKKIIGLSKIPRIVDTFSKRLQIQERLTKEIADAFQNIVNPRGLGVVIDAVHMCSVMRGVKKNNAKMITNVMLGNFREDVATRSEFMNNLSRS